MQRLTAFQTTLMVAIEANNDPSGQDLIRWVEANADKHCVDTVNHGRAYPNLDELVEKGYVTKGEQDKRTNYYALTDAGRERLEARHGFIGSVL